MRNTVICRKVLLTQIDDREDLTNRMIFKFILSYWIKNANKLSKDISSYILI
jgi:hypothetical protein